MSAFDISALAGMLETTTELSELHSNIGCSSALKIVTPGSMVPASATIAGEADEADADLGTKQVTNLARTYAAITLLFLDLAGAAAPDVEVGKKKESQMQFVVSLMLHTVRAP